MTTSQTGQNDENRLHFLDYWRIIRLRKGIIFLNFIVVVLAATFLTYLFPKQYKSVVRMEVRKDSASDITGLGLRQVENSYDPYFILTQFERLQSSDVLYPVIDEMKLDKIWSARMGGKPLTRQLAKSLLRRSIRLNQVRNTSIIEVEVYSKDKQEAADIANYIANTYKTNRDAQRIEMANRGIEKLREKFFEQSNIVAQAHAEVRKVRNETGIDVLVDTGRVASLLDSQRLQALELQQIEYSAQYAQKKKQLEELRKLDPLQLRNAILTVVQQEILLTRLLEQYNSAKQELVSKGGDLGPSHPDMLRLNGVLIEIETQVTNRVSGIMQGLDSELQALKASNDDRLSRLDDAKKANRLAADKGQLYLEARKNLERQERIRDTIELKIEMEEVNKGIGRDSVVQIIDAAEPAIKAAWPKPSLNIAAGIFFGLAMGIGMAFFIEYLDTSVKTIDDVEKALDAPVLAVIPQNVGSLLEEGLDSPHAEPYRVLRTNIMFTSKNPDASTITVVSGGAGEGKSTTVINLATIFAQNNHRVLLVDSDLRRPSLHKRLGKTNSPGLTNVLLGKSKLEEVVQKSGQPGMDFLASGKLPSSAMGILNSQQMRDFVKEVKGKYDYVLFDSPPLMGVSDATVLASLADLSLLVVQYRKYPQSLAIRSRQMVDKVGGTLLGVVLNNINVSNDASYYYYSGAYYHSENSDEEMVLQPLGKSQRHSAAADSASIDLKSKY